MVNSPLSPANFRRVIKELDQVGTAVSVVGTKRVMLGRLADMVQPMVDVITGSRPEANRIRGDMARAVHNMRTSSTGALKASRSIMRCLDAVRELNRLVTQRGVAGVPPMFSVDGFDLENSWGYSKTEIRATMAVLKKANKTISGTGLKLDSMYVILDPKISDRYFRFIERDDVFVSDPGKSVSGDLKEVMEAVGQWVWLMVMDGDDRDMWIGDQDAFSRAFALKLATGLISKDESQMLMDTVGKYAPRWPS